LPLAEPFRVTRGGHRWLLNAPIERLASPVSCYTWTRNYCTAAGMIGWVRCNSDRWYPRTDRKTAGEKTALRKERERGREGGREGGRKRERERARARFVIGHSGIFPSGDPFIARARNLPFSKIIVVMQARCH